MKAYTLPTGYLFTDQYSKGQLETLSIGDYGKHYNVKADFLGYSRPLDGVPNTWCMPLSEKWVVTLSTQYGCPMKCTFCDVPKVEWRGNATVEDLKQQLYTAIALFPGTAYTERLNIHFARMGDPIFNNNVFAFARWCYANKKAIHEFSPGSRRTLLDKLMSLEPDAWHTAKFLTLTYHDSVPPPKRAKDDLRAFYKRLVRYVKTKKRGSGYRPSWFWRMEIKERLSGDLVGQPAPHFHIFLFGCPYIPRDMMLQWWHEITGDSSITQLDVKRLDNRRKGMNYVSKYVAKPMETDKDFGSASEAGAYLDISLYLAAMGRFWGFEGGQDIPFAVVKEMVYPALDPSLLNFVTVLENLYPHLLSRWSFGFKIFEFGDEMERIKSIWFEIMFPIADLDEKLPKD